MVHSVYRTLIGNHRQAIDRQASYTAYNPICSYINRANVSQASRRFVSNSWPFLLCLTAKFAANYAKLSGTSLLIKFDK